MKAEDLTEEQPSQSLSVSLLVQGFIPSSNKFSNQLFLHFVFFLLFYKREFLLQFLILCHNPLSSGRSFLSEEDSFSSKMVDVIGTTCPL